MKNALIGATALSLVAATGFAGGLDRSGQSISPLFAADGTTSLSFGIVLPSVTGRDKGGSGSGKYDAGTDYSQGVFSYTNSVSDAFSYTVIADHPYGADVSYDDSPFTSNLGGTYANLNSQALSFVGRFKLGDRFSVFGGVRTQRIGAQLGLNGLSYAAAISTATVADTIPGVTTEQLGGALQRDPAAIAAIAPTLLALPGSSGNVLSDLAAIGAGVQNLATGAVPGALPPGLSQGFLPGGGYNFSMKATTEIGYLLGAAYEIPDIALRFAATYHFETEHKADTTETIYGLEIPGTVEFKTPASLNLEFQTGVAPGTLVTASYRWTEFSAVNIVPSQLGADLVNLDDSHRYTLGVARQMNDKLALSASLIYEPTGTGDTVSPLSPTDGQRGISVGARFSDGPLNVSMGLNYTQLGDADAGIAGQSVAEFRNNHVIGIGFKAEMKF